MGALAKISISRESKFGNFKQESVCPFSPLCVLILALKPEGRTTEYLRFLPIPKCCDSSGNLHHGYAESKGNTTALVHQCMMHQYRVHYCPAFSPQMASFFCSICPNSLKQSNSYSCAICCLRPSVRHWARGGSYSSKQYALPQ